MKFLVDEGSVGLSFELGCWLKESERQSCLLSEISSFEFGCPPRILPSMRKKTCPTSGNLTA